MLIREREAQWDRLEQAWRRCTAGEQAVVLVEGAAGCGTTQLLHRLARHAAAHGAHVLHAAGHGAHLPHSAGHGAPDAHGDAGGGTPQPYGVLRTLLHALPAGPLAPPARNTARCVPGQFAAAVAVLAGRAPVVVCVDDLQDCDPPSLEHLARLSSGPHRAPLLLALGHVLGVRGPHAPALTAPFLHHENFCRVRVGRLSPRGVAQALPAGAAPALPPARLYQLTGGNPLLCKALLEEEPAPRGPQGLRPAPEGPFLQAVTACLRRSGEPAGRLARALAVLGQDASAERVARTAALTPSTAAHVRDVLDAAGLVTGWHLRHPAVAALILAASAPHASAALYARAAHALHTSGAPAPVTARHLRQACTSPSPALPACAGHTPQAARWAVPVLTEAARQALAQDDTAEAVDCLRLALRLGADGAERHAPALQLAALLRRTDPAQAEHHLTGPLQALARGELAYGETVLLARTLLAQGRVEQAGTVLEHAARRRAAGERGEALLRGALAPSDTDTVCASAAAEAAPAATGGSPGAGAGVGAEAAPGAGAGAGAGAVRGRLSRTGALSAAADGDVHDAFSPANFPPLPPDGVADADADAGAGAGGVRRGRPGHAAAPPAAVRAASPDTGALFAPWNAAAPHEPAGGTDPAAARLHAATASLIPPAPAGRDAEAVERVLKDTPLTPHTLDLVLREIRTLLHADHADRALVWCQKLQAEADRHRSPGWFAALGLLHAQALLRLGDPRAARHAAAAAATAVEERGGLLLPALVSVEITACTATGEYDEAARRLELPLPDALFTSVYAVDLLRARGLYYLATHRHTAALAEFLDAGRLARRWGLDHPRHLPWRTDAARALLHLDRPEHAARLIAEQAARPSGRDARPHAAALRLRAALAPAAERPALLTRALEELRRCGDRLEHAHALADLADALQLNGEGNRAGVLARRAWHLAADCGARPLCERILPGRTGGLGPQVSGRTAPAPGGTDRLTGPEQRVAALAAFGYTNREISAKLYVTPSTIEQHLTKIYRKLGISRRGELPLDLEYEVP